VSGLQVTDGSKEENRLGALIDNEHCQVNIAAAGGRDVLFGPQFEPP
jgi:hypothetical protein